MVGYGRSWPWAYKHRIVAIRLGATVLIDLEIYASNTWLASYSNIWVLKALHVRTAFAANVPVRDWDPHYVFQATFDGW